MRYQVELIGPDSVATASDTAFRALRELRDLVEAGALHRDDIYLGQRDLWDAAFGELRAHESRFVNELMKISAALLVPIATHHDRRVRRPLLTLTGRTYYAARRHHAGSS